MKHAIVLVTTFAAGVGVGVLVHSLAKPQAIQPIIAQQWNETEEQTRKRMKDFQTRLDNLQQPPSPDSTARLAKEMELQQGIDDILIRYRESQQAQYAPYLTGGLAGSALTLLGGFVTLLVKRGSRSNRNRAAT